MIRLTDEYLKAPIARAVPGARYDRETRAWVLDEPTPRGAAVACRLFPGIEHDWPILAELRDSMSRDAAPTDYADALGLRIKPPRVLEQLGRRGWSLHEDQEIVLGYAEACLREHKGFYLAAYRGWGKTLGTACLMDVLGTSTNLVVVPNSAKVDTWERELAGDETIAGLAPWLKVLVLPQDKAKRALTLDHARAMAAAGTPFALVIHWEALAVVAGTRQGARGKLPDKGWKQLGITWDLLVADEGHRLANPKSLQSRAIKTIPRRMAMLASGSVFQNKWEELFSPAQFLFPARYKSAWRDWNDRFLDYVENGYAKICIGVKEEAVDALQRELGVWMVYRERESTATPNPVYVEMSDEQRRVYDDLVSTCLAELEDGTVIKAKAGIAMLTKLRQIASGLDLVSRLRDSTKLDAAVRVVQDYGERGDDFAIFVWYKSSAHVLAERLEAAGYESWVVTGDVPQKHRTEALRAFRAGERRVFIGTIPTIGESVNLQRANHVIRVDRSWNPALNRQVVDRVDRQGQTRPVTLTDIITRDSVDELVVLPNLANKDALRRAVLGGTT